MCVVGLEGKMRKLSVLVGGGVEGAKKKENLGSDRER